MKAYQAKDLADAARVVPPAYTTLTTQINTAATAGAYFLNVSTATITTRVLSELLLDGFGVRDLGTGQSEISWR